MRGLPIRRAGGLPWPRWWRYTTSTWCAGLVVAAFAGVSAELLVAATNTPAATAASATNPVSTSRRRIGRSVPAGCDAGERAIHIVTAP